MAPAWQSLLVLSPSHSTGSARLDEWWRPHTCMVRCCCCRCCCMVYEAMARTKTVAVAVPLKPKPHSCSRRAAYRSTYVILDAHRTSRSQQCQHACKLHACMDDYSEHPAWLEALHVATSCLVGHRCRPVDHSIPGGDNRDRKAVVAGVIAVA